MGGIGDDELLRYLRSVPTINFTTNATNSSDRLLNYTVVPQPHPGHETVASVFSILAVAGFLENLIFLVCLIRRPKRYQPSFNFIGHLFFINMLTCAYLLPVFVVNLRLETFSPFAGIPEFLCRWQAFLTCVFWTTLFYNMACIAGVHLSLIGGVPYTVIFGLSPRILCLTMWIIGIFFALPILFNQGISSYDSLYHHCLWKQELGNFKFLVNFGLIGTFFPLSLMWYAYSRILIILFTYHTVDNRASRAVKGRTLAAFTIGALMSLPLIQIPFVIISGMPVDTLSQPESIYPIVAFVAGYAPCMISGSLYHLSLEVLEENFVIYTNEEPVGGAQENNNFRRDTVVSLPNYRPVPEEFL